MEKQKYQIGDLVKVRVDDENNIVMIGKVVSIGIAGSDATKFSYGVSYDLNGTKADENFLSNGDDTLFRYIIGKVKVIEEK